MAAKVGFKYRVRGVRPGASEHLPLAIQSRLREPPASVAGRHENFFTRAADSFLSRGPLGIHSRFDELRVSESSKLGTIGQDHEVIVVPGVVAVGRIAKEACLGGIVGRRASATRASIRWASFSDESCVFFFAAIASREKMQPRLFSAAELWGLAFTNSVWANAPSRSPECSNSKLEKLGNSPERAGGTAPRLGSTRWRRLDVAERGQSMGSIAVQLETKTASLLVKRLKPDVRLEPAQSRVSTVEGLVTTSCAVEHSAPVDIEGADQANDMTGSENLGVVGQQDFLGPTELCSAAG